MTLDDGYLPSNEVRDLLNSFGHLQSFQAFDKVTVPFQCDSSIAKHTLVIFRRVLRLPVCSIRGRELAELDASERTSSS